MYKFKYIFFTTEVFNFLILKKKMTIKTLDIAIEGNVLPFFNNFGPSYDGLYICYF